jgi:hypothetical protein
MSSSDPASLVRAVTPSDTVEFSLCRALYVGVGGNVTVLSDGVPVTFLNVPTGLVLPVETTQVRATGTTATNIVALY